METKTVTLRIPAELLRQMQVLAHEHTRSLNGEFIVAVKEHVRKHLSSQKGEGKG